MVIELKTLLCVEDERDLLENNCRFFINEGYKVLAAENLAKTREHLKKNTPDCIILDIMLPDGNGLEFLKELRSQGNYIPVLMLTAWNTDADISRGLDYGADDYIGKPFSYDVLLARVKRMLAHAEWTPEHITYGPLYIEMFSGQAYLHGENMRLTSKEISLLTLFIQQSNRLMSAEYLYERVWGQKMMDDDNAVKVAISKLRSKLAGSGYTITASRGEGYYFERI